MLESDNEWRCEKMKNNSAYHLECVDRGIKDKEGFSPSAESVRLFKMLGSFLKNAKEENPLKGKRTIYNVGNSKKDAENKKEGTKFLHKVSSYLHIIL